MSRQIGRDLPVDVGEPASRFELREAGLTGIGHGHLSSGTSLEYSHGAAMRPLNDEVDDPMPRT